MTLINRYSWILALLFCLNACNDDVWEGLQEGSSVPAFSLQSETGAQVTADSLKGHPYLIVFFNTDCKDCRHELPVVQELYNNYKYDIPFVCVARDESSAEVAQYWQQQGFTIPYYTPEDNLMYHEFAQYGVPRIYLVDANGIISESFDDSDMPDYATMSGYIDKCLDADANYAGLSIKAGVSASRSSDASYSYNEYSINKLYAYFYDADTKELVKQSQVYNLTKLENSYDQNYDITYLCDAVRVRAGKYDIFLIANTNYPPVDVVKEDDFLDTIDSLSYSTGIIANPSENGILMTNTASVNCNVDLSNQAHCRYELHVEMERALAKVQLGCSQTNYSLTHNNEKYADINLTNYQFVNLNTRFYLFHHSASLHSLKRPTRYSIQDNFATYDAVMANGCYIIDSYFFDKTTDDGVYTAIAEKYQSPFVGFGSKHMSSMPAVGNVASAYILENTCYATSQKNGYNVGIVFKGSVHPVCVYTYDTSSHTMLKETRSEYWPEQLYFWNYNFYGSLRSLNIASGLNIDELKTYTDAELLKYGVKQVIYNMGVYETYYTYWIRHNIDAPTSGTMKYGIVRNCFYNLKITGISGIGNSSITPNPSRDNDDNSYSDDITVQ